MGDFLKELQRNIEETKKLANKIEEGQMDITELKAYLLSMNQMITVILELSMNQNLKLELNHEFIVQVLNDVIYGIENEDPVLLQDVLQYGLLEIYYYINEEYQNEVIYE